MKFIDEARIQVAGGDGGDGCISFRREKYVPRGGPNGGDGGRGGHVILRTDLGLSTLLDFQYKRHFRAERGGHGKGKEMSGRQGADLLLRIPVGTIVRDEATGRLVADLSEPGQELMVARGGDGGRGNIHFATATNRAPRKAKPGTAGEQRWILLELKLLADVGLLGLPNAGKSTLLSRISRARPKIADYPFTTKNPVLGVATVGDRSFTAADLPGLIEGASHGVGLGSQFLKHIERTRVFLHLIDLSSHDDPLQPYETIRNELANYDPEFLRRPELVVLTKIDLPEVRNRLYDAKKRLRKTGKKVLVLSAATGEGVKNLLAKTGELVWKETSGK